MRDEDAGTLGETSRGLLDTPAEERFDRLTRLVRYCLGVNFSLLTVLTPDRQWFKSAQGTLLSETPVELAFCRYTLKEGRPLVLDDLVNHPEHGCNPVVCGAPHLRFYAGVPLKGPAGDWVGSLCALDDKPRRLSAEQMAVLQDLARCAEREIATTAWTGAEQEVLDQAARSLRGSLIDPETRAWSSSAILDILLRESERSRQHGRTLMALLLKTDLDDPERARSKAELLRQNLASYQSLGRLDPGSFLIVLPELAPPACEKLACSLANLVDGAARAIPIQHSLSSREEARDYCHRWAAGEEPALSTELAPGLQARCFGPFQVTVNGQPIAARSYRTKKTRLLLAYLLSAPGRKANDDLLIEQFWPDALGDAARNSLRGALSTLRSLLRQGSDADPFQRDGGWIQLAPNQVLWSDLHEFEKLRASQDENDLATALELAGGPFMEGDYEDWVLRRRDALAEAVLETARRLAAQAFSRADFARSAQVLEQALALQPERQDLTALLFRSWLRLGRPEAVRKRYEELRAELKRDHDSEPSLELLELYHRAELGLSG